MEATWTGYMRSIESLNPIYGIDGPGHAPQAMQFGLMNALRTGNPLYDLIVCSVVPTIMVRLHITAVRCRTEILVLSVPPPLASS